MSFEEDFPSLSVKVVWEKCLYGYTQFTIEEIQEYCLDKKRVREVLEKLCCHSKDGYGTIHYSKFIKELGL